MAVFNSRPLSDFDYTILRRKGDDHYIFALTRSALTPSALPRFLERLMLYQMDDDWDWTVADSAVVMKNLLTILADENEDDD